MTDCIADINVHLEDQIHEQWIHESSLQCGSQGVIQMNGVPQPCILFYLTFTYLEWFPLERLGNVIRGIYLGMGGHICLKFLGFIWILRRYNIKDYPGLLPFCSIYIKPDHLVFLSHMGLSKGYQEMKTRFLVTCLIMTVLPTPWNVLHTYNHLW